MCVAITFLFIRGEARKWINKNNFQIIITILNTQKLKPNQHTGASFNRNITTHTHIYLLSFNFQLCFKLCSAINAKWFTSMRIPQNVYVLSVRQLVLTAIRALLHILPRAYFLLYVFTFSLICMCALPSKAISIWLQMDALYCGVYWPQEPVIHMNVWLCGH